MAPGLTAKALRDLGDFFEGFNGDSKVKKSVHQKNFLEFACSNDVTLKNRKGALVSAATELDDLVNNETMAGDFIGDLLRHSVIREAPDNDFKNLLVLNSMPEELKLLGCIDVQNYNFGLMGLACDLKEVTENLEPDLN